ncbi:TetR/AcrR family transcriptional regulator [Bradyrhizobium sp. CCBAU 11434]|uniref:TetR/AcrR family transcriptional regulator n=1 Tax=Bradyrhizobium sp. CCBAU 11434 TaxID=1630885 RepID=UPI002305D0EF|nr:TetR/AcrR family transcriptional regulator [Bradyrhizobium sp. CCBAU 11434]
MPPIDPKQLDLLVLQSNINDMNQRVIQKSFARPNSDGRREQIIDAALKVMISDGVYHATTRKIAEAAGVNVATLHYHFHDKEEILFKVMEVLVANYRSTLAKQFAAPQKLHDRIADLLQFIWSEIRKAPGEQLALQEMTLYVLRRPHAEHMAREKDHEFLLLYADWLRAATDVHPEDESRIMELANFIYTSFVGMLNQWLAVQDADLFAQAMENLIRAGQELAARSLPKRSLKRGRA